ncbi:MAG TPA: DNA-3-methyladenine glycosylase 2 family protein [Casimicrobiaceae bacterium]|nr:DNA-3-methyladenine glycosylase 2 family protein [Casimicrobiaceae bacterium]
MTKPAYWDEASRQLAEADPVLARLINAYPGLHIMRRSDAFTALCRAIVGQQISVKAADAIWRRLALAANPAAADVAFPSLPPVRVMALTVTELRTIGLSERKASYVRDLAAHFVEGRLKPATWAALDDESLIAALCDVKGIGRWTAEMFLMFHELRPDVFPVDDLGLQKAIAMHYHRGRRVTLTTIKRHGKRWRPWRSVATWYLWRALDPEVVEY